MSTVFLLLGGNIGNTKEKFKQAQSLIIKYIGDIVQQSSNYQSDAWGFKSSNSFLNCVIITKTNLTPYDLLKKTQEIEVLLGRKQKTKTTYESRIIDIDILFYDNKIIESDTLSIPHPRLHLRKFTLEPLLALSPNFVHPTLQKTIVNIYQECKDTSKITKVLD